MKKSLILLLALILSLFVIVGCEGDAAVNAGGTNIEVANEEVANEEVVEEVAEEVKGITFVDSNEREITLESKPKRVIALYGSFADLWFEAGGELVGINDSSRLPEKSADLPKLGKLSAPNIEAILALEPDFIILRAGYASHDKLLPIFEENKITVMFVDYNSFDETMATFELFCRINETESIYEEKGLSMIKRVEDLAKEKLDFSYLLLFSSSKRVVAKDDNITASIIDTFGGKNIAKDHSIANEESKQFSFEKILELDPTFIFVQTMGSVEDAKARLEKDVISNPAWGALTAVKEERFIYLPKELFLYKPNMRFVEAYEYIVDLIEIIK